MHSNVRFGLLSSSLPLLVSPVPLQQCTIHLSFATRIINLRVSNSNSLFISQPAAALLAGAPPNHRTKIIISSHNYNRTPDLSELRETVRKMVELGADVVKIAAMVTDIGDNIKLFQILQEAQVRFPVSWFSWWAIAYGVRPKKTPSYVSQAEYAQTITRKRHSVGALDR